MKDFYFIPRQIGICLTMAEKERKLHKLRSFPGAKTEFLEKK